ncbi:hypothetical protein M422DRAFT_268039 [Sphaerobolus stellatus SS14]|uniref:Unplaced genomic scaffold SPHSTscaffold_186, whole genome shotgun sequence n=1 Tax=Sphaerobolus stellatus (strain SS14) TaxID=990650 RepID=A0A0C9TL14_SPHS4|nr:hypothetical protein M422DRAFT_268039 [Sphaerobolus stellatus SS14]
MKVVYSSTCLVHNPEYETLSGKRVPYLESPQRYEVIKEALSDSEDSFGFVEASEDLEIGEHLLSVHNPEYVEYVKNAYDAWVEDGGDEAGVVPDTFPHPKLINFKNGDIDVTKLKPIAKAGLYCFDLSTPITADTYKAAIAAVQVTLTACSILTTESKASSSEGPVGVFALTRPPGHHAATSLSGGYCYFNNVAIAARFLQSQAQSPSSVNAESKPKIAILDIDYHHGNGTQDIFYADPSVYYVSLHAVPDYPYYTGTASETGFGPGKGYTLNLPLPTYTTGDEEYLAALRHAVHKINEFGAEYVVVSLGVDTYQHDPICKFGLTTAGYRRVGGAIARAGAGVGTVFVMEGGYFIADLGANVRAVLEGYQTAGKGAAAAGSA